MGIDYNAGIMFGFKYSDDEIDDVFLKDDDEYELNGKKFNDRDDLIEAIAAAVGGVFCVCFDGYNDDSDSELVIGPRMPKGHETGAGRFNVEGGYSLTAMIEILPAAAEIEKKLKALGLSVSGGPLLHTTWSIC